MDYKFFRPQNLYFRDTGSSRMILLCVNLFLFKKKNRIGSLFHKIHCTAPTFDSKFYKAFLMYFHCASIYWNPLQCMVSQVLWVYLKKVLQKQFQLKTLMPKYCVSIIALVLDAEVLMILTFFSVPFLFLLVHFDPSCDTALLS